MLARRGVPRQDNKLEQKTETKDEKTTIESIAELKQQAVEILQKTERLRDRLQACLVEINLLFMGYRFDPQMEVPSWLVSIERQVFLTELENVKRDLEKNKAELSDDLARFKSQIKQISTMQNKHLKDMENAPRAELILLHNSGSDAEMKISTLVQGMQSSSEAMDIEYSDSNMEKINATVHRFKLRARRLNPFIARIATPIGTLLYQSMLDTPLEYTAVWSPPDGQLQICINTPRSLLSSDISTISITSHFPLSTTRENVIYPQPDGSLRTVLEFAGFIQGGDKHCFSASIRGQKPLLPSPFQFTVHDNFGHPIPYEEKIPRFPVGKYSPNRMLAAVITNKSDLYNAIRIGLNTLVWRVGLQANGTFCPWENENSANLLTNEMMQALHQIPHVTPGKIDVFWLIGGNRYMSALDTVMQSERASTAFGEEAARLPAYGIKGLIIDFRDGHPAPGSRCLVDEGLPCPQEPPQPGQITLSPKKVARIMGELKTHAPATSIVSIIPNTLVTTIKQAKTNQQEKWRQVWNETAIGMNNWFPWQTLHEPQDILEFITSGRIKAPLIGPAALMERDPPPYSLELQLQEYKEIWPAPAPVLAVIRTTCPGFTEVPVHNETLHNFLKEREKIPPQKNAGSFFWPDESFAAFHGCRPWEWGRQDQKDCIPPLSIYPRMYPTSVPYRNLKNGLTSVIFGYQLYKNYLPDINQVLRSADLPLYPYETGRHRFLGAVACVSPYSLQRDIEKPAQSNALLGFLIDDINSDQVGLRYTGSRLSLTQEACRGIPSETITSDLARQDKNPILFWTFRHQQILGINTAERFLTESFTLHMIKKGHSPEAVSIQLQIIYMATSAMLALGAPNSGQAWWMPIFHALNTSLMVSQNYPLLATIHYPLIIYRAYEDFSGVAVGYGLSRAAVYVARTSICQSITSSLYNGFTKVGGTICHNAYRAAGATIPWVRIAAQSFFGLPRRLFSAPPSTPTPDGQSGPVATSDMQFRS